jgi:hypothetical protein
VDPLAPLESSAIAWTANLKVVPVNGNQEPVVVARVRRGLWGAVDQGILHLITESDFEAIDLLRLPERSDTRVGRLPFLVPKEFPAMTFSRDGRWILTNQVDRRESDLMLMDNFR